MSKLSFRARALDASKPMPIYLAEELPDLPDYSAINRAVPQMPSGMEKEEESEHHLQRAISGTGLIIPTPEVCEVSDLEFYERCYPPDYKMPKQHIHMQPLWEEQEAPEYDIDSEDDRWLKQQRHPELTEWKFEQMMDKLEKSSGQTVVTLHEAKLLLERHDDLVTAVYDYWLNKRLTTQHALILSVKTESRPGLSTNNPYLAFRRRTEKMQTRKNRKNDESSYEKMLKLRRDLARALTLLELVARRETAKRELVKLTAQLAERRYAAGDFANQLLPDPPPRPQYTTVSLTAHSFRAYSAAHYPPRAPPTPVDTPRQREKRPYKRRKFRHPAAAPPARGETPLGGLGASSSDSEVADDGPFAFRRKPGCYYEMPTTTLCGDPAEERPSELYDHELDERHRFTLTSITHPYPRCVGFARRRVCRGGRVALDRVRTPLDDLWGNLTFDTDAHRRRVKDEEVELETKAHRTPKEITRDYHSGGKYPWRHAFRQHLARNPHLWTEPDIKPIKMDIDIKTEPEEPKYINEDLKTDLKFNEYNSVDDKYISDEVKYANDEGNSVSDSDRARTIECSVRESLRREMRKRTWSGSDSSYESDESLQPVETEFEKFIDEVNKKWLHFRPKTPPPSPPPPDSCPDDQVTVALDTPLAVELTAELPTSGLDTFTTSEFTLSDLYGDVNPEDHSGSSLDVSGEDLLNENFTGLTEAQVESILSETDLKALADVDLTKEDAKEDILDVDSFLLQGQGMEGRACPGWRRSRGRGGARGHSTVAVRAPASPPLYLPPLQEPETHPVPTSKIIVEEVNEVQVPPPQIKVEKPPPREKRKEDSTIEEVSLPHGVQLKTVQTKHSPLKKHIITSAAHRRASDVTVTSQDSTAPQIVTVAVSESLKRKEDSTIEEVSLPHGVQLKTVHTKHSPLKKHIITSAAHRRASDVIVTSQDSSAPQIVTVAVSESLKVRLQNHLLSTQSGVLVQNGPFPPVAVALPLHHREAAVASVSSGGGVATAVTAGGRRVNAPLVQLSHKPLQLQHAPLVVTPPHLHHVPANKLKVLHAHPLTHAQRAQLLGRAGGAGPAVGGVVLGVDKPPLKQQQLTQLIEIKAKQLGKGPHLVNVVRQPQPGTVARLELNDAKRRPIVSLEGATRPHLPTRPHRVSLSLDARHVVRAAIPTRPQIQLKNRTLVTTPVARSSSDPSSSIAITTSKATSIPSSVVANLLHKNVQLPKGATPKLSIAGGSPLAANVQAIAFTTAQLKARQARLAPPRPPPNNDMIDPLAASTEPLDDDDVRRRDSLPMEVT